VEKSDDESDESEMIASLGVYSSDGSERSRKLLVGQSPAGINVNAEADVIDEDTEG
jgi:hypothetical protein